MDERIAAALAASSGASKMLAAALPGLGVAFVIGAYFFILLDRQRANSPSKDDTQVGLKLVLFGVMFSGLALAVNGTADVLAYALGGFKGGSIKLREAIPSILIGGGVGALAWKLFLPRTNYASARQPERFFLGAVAVTGAIAGMVALNNFLTGLFTEAAWVETSAGLAGALPAGAVAVLAFARLGQLSGWTAPPPRAVPPQYPPAGGGYPPQGGGYPPQGGGYPPQGGGYPPQGGGYPPQGGGGYPPPGGYPPTA